MIVCGTIAFAWFGSATSFAPSQLIPRENFWDSMSFWSTLCFAFSGFEFRQWWGRKSTPPQDHSTQHCAVPGLAVTAIYTSSVPASILVAVPPSEMVERSGIAEAVEAVTTRLGSAGLAP